MPKHVPHKDGDLVLSYRQADDAVVNRAALGFVESKVAGEERRASSPAQQGYDLLILHSGSAHFMSDLPNVNAPATQELALALDYVLVEDVHEPVNRTGGGTSAMSASRAMRMASAIAS